MTFGGGMSGCLGHGNYDDVAKVYVYSNVVIIVDVCFSCTFLAQAGGANAAI